MAPLSALAASIALGAAPAANAGLLVSSAINCPSEVLDQPFVPWADPAQVDLKKLRVAFFPSNENLETDEDTGMGPGSGPGIH